MVQCKNNQYMSDTIIYSTPRNTYIYWLIIMERIDLRSKSILIPSSIFVKFSPKTIFEKTEPTINDFKILHMI